MHSLHSQGRRPQSALKGASHNSHLVNEASVMCQSSIPWRLLGCQLSHGPPPPSLETEGSWGTAVRRDLSVTSPGEQGRCATSQLSPQRMFYHPTRHTAAASCLESSGLGPQRHEGRETSKDTNWATRCYIQEKQGAAWPHPVGKSQAIHERHLGRDGRPLLSLTSKAGAVDAPHTAIGSLTAASSGPLLTDSKNLVLHLPIHRPPPS